MGVDQEQKIIFTGSGEGELKAWLIDSEALTAGLKETESGEASFHFQHRDIHRLTVCVTL